MKDYPLISVIIPVYNAEQYLEKCVKSVLNQTYTDLEIILVDDGSIDNSPSICDDLAFRDSRIKVIHKENGGVSSARNVGVKSAKGYFIGFVDSDDHIASDMYEKLISGYISCPRVGIVSCRIWREFDGQTPEPFEYWSWGIKENTMIASKDYAKAAMTDKFMLSLCNKIIRKDLFDGVAFPEGRNNEDSYFLFKIADNVEHLNCDMLQITDRLYYYHATPESIYHLPKIPLEIDIIKNLDEIYEDWSSRRQDLLEYIEEKRVSFLITLCKKIISNKKWSEYKTFYFSRLKNVSNIFVLKKMGKKALLVFLKLKYLSH